MYPKPLITLCALFITLPAWAGSMASVGLNVDYCVNLADSDSSLVGTASASIGAYPLCQNLPNSSGSVAATAKPGTISMSASVNPYFLNSFSAFMDAQSTWTMFVPGSQVGWFETTIRIRGGSTAGGEQWGFSGPGFNFVSDPFMCIFSSCDETFSFLSDPIAVPAEGQAFLFSMTGYAPIYDNQDRTFTRQATLDVQFHPMPEPASGGLMILGILGLYLRRATQRTNKT